MKREIAILALAALIVLAAGTPASAVFAFPSGPTELRAQACNTEAASEESGTFSGNCAGTYPAACATDKISCNDATAETATTSENNQFMGIKASAYNATVGNCAGITSVKLCYEWWSSSNNIDTCRVKVDANGGGSFSTASSACPGTSANPGEICADVTALETWTCPNFFNATGTRALAFLEAESSTDSSKTLTVDDLYFNVTYTADSTPPAVAINYPRNVTYNSSVTTLNSTASDANLSACWYSLNRGVSNASFACNANVTGLAPVSGINIWTVWANDSFGNLNSSTISFSVNQPPVISNATVSPNPIAGSTTITIYANATANGVNDSEANSLDFYCGTTSTPTAANTNCTGGTTSSAYPYALSCTFTTESASGNYTKYCRVYDGNSYSPSVQANYAVNATPLSTTIASVAGDTTPSYIDTLNDGVTSIIVSGETGMSCRWGSSDLAYYSMNNSCTTTGMQANCPVSDVASQGFTTRYVSCQNALGIGQNSTNNLDVAFYLDYTAPTTSDNSNTSVNAPPYSVTITESDNVDGNPTTLYCTDTAGTCIPGTSIDNGGTVTFNSSNRGRNYFRYYSTDFAGNVQATQNKTININQLPAFTSSTGTTGTILGGTTAAITTTSSDPDAGQNLRLYVCSSSGASSSGCAGSQYCTALSASNPTCAFASETNTANHAWYAYLYDELGEGATSNPLTGNYSTDSTPPAITVTTPANATYNTGNITLSIITSEAASSAWYSLEGGANATMSNDSSTHWNKTLSALSDGTHSVTFYANDSVGNVGSSPAISFSIDKTPPSITILSPANGSYRTASNVPIIISSNEALSWAGYRINGGALANLANTTTTNWNATISLADESTFNLTIYANDTAGNQGNATITFYTDSLPPRFTATT
ncbi:hypothetical protein HY095_04095, partial [Candidatus Micrarchaeota archaeon]|nr:hypothetical protein [Candidatus Micrarchaeota archaeon]